jgi:hypothetical protein
MGVLAVGGIAATDSQKRKKEPPPKTSSRVFDSHSMDKAQGQLPGEGKNFSSLGMVSIGDMTDPKAAAREAAKAGEDADAAQQAAGAEGAAAQGNDQIAQAMAAAQAQAHGADVGNAASNRAAKLPGGKGQEFGQGGAGGQSSGARFGDASGAGQGGPAARADNGAGRISSFAKGGAQTSRTNALVTQRANRARGFSARQLASVANDSAQARNFSKGGGQRETFAAAAGRSFDGASLDGQAITGAGGGIMGQGAAAGAAVQLGGGGGGGGGGKDTTPGPNNCQAGTTWNAASSACLPVTDDADDECDAEIGQQSTAEGWRHGMENGHVTVRDHRSSAVSLSGAAGCSKDKRHLVRDHRRHHDNDDPDQHWINRAHKILALAATVAAMQMSWRRFIWGPLLAMIMMGCGAALTTIGAKFVSEGRYMLGAIWMAIGATVSALAWIGSSDLKGKAKTVADTITGGDYSSSTPDPVPANPRDHRT